MKHHLQRSGRQCNVHSSLMIPKILVDRPQQNKSNSELRKSVEILNVISYCEEVLWCHITERKQKTSDLPGWRPEHESTFKNIPSITDWNDGNNVSRHPICVSRESVTFRSMQTKNCLSQAKPKASKTKQKLALEFATELWRTIKCYSCITAKTLEILFGAQKNRFGWVSSSLLSTNRLGGSQKLNRFGAQIWFIKYNRLGVWLCE